ncbi:oxidoreductase [Aspergillus bombycis]|uniref:Oxidoreductase n=1 Tax=Aspergillus bombycis TaxID=109264 RepID=A0A1F8A731_9EURO|nr:oxidoreductase [Aspergillus bombycis]OGM47517.1 oxidoreductase [Aspergillus bombycis]
MSPIRVGLIGLHSASAEKYEGTSWTANAHLPFLTKSPNFEIVALLNSSVDSAQTAIQKYGLPDKTKAYGDPQDLANDPNVDLVVCSVRVDRHFLTVRPSLIAGKAVYVEWPLDRNLEVAQEMATLAAKHNARTIVGIQGAFSPIIHKMRSVIESDQIGRVLSSTITGSFGNNVDAESKNVRYFLDREVGGNTMTIHVGHSLEFIAAGESFSSISRPTIDIKDYSVGEAGKIVETSARNTVPDQVLVYGTVEPSNAAVTIKFHAGKEFPGQPRLDWRIQGEKGWLRLASPHVSLNVGGPGIKLEIARNETKEVEELLPETDEWDELPVFAQNIARLYEAYRKNEWYPTFDWALKRHEAIDGIWKEFDADNH